ncbi:MAG: excinuclease ABC subunit UvrA [bacterium]|nr:excinuclease ABC subunit UvrA [bacterium]
MPENRRKRAGYSPKHIEVRGARIHNLKGVDVRIPRNSLTVFTGVSGSGKSSLAFDTLYAEGQRRYIESLSSYARQFLGQMEKPEVDSITGLSPAISIDQKTASVNPRSTVGTVTEIHDYLRVLYARLGTPHCPHCGERIGSQTVDQMVDRVHQLEVGTRFFVLAPLARGQKGTFKELFADLIKQGFSRVRVDGEIHRLDEAPKLAKTKRHDIEVVVDRLALTDSVASRLHDALETALGLAKGSVRILTTADDEILLGAAHACQACELSFEPVEPRSFSFNSHFGACAECQGLGVVNEPDPDLIVKNELTIRKGAIGEIANWIEGKAHWSDSIQNTFKHYGIDIDKPFGKLTAKHKRIIFYGDPTVKDHKRRDHFLVPLDAKANWGAKEWRLGGLIPNLLRRYKNASSDASRRHWGNMMVERSCQACGGYRLKPESMAVSFRGKGIHEMSELPVGELFDLFETLELVGDEAEVAGELVLEIRERLGFLVRVGLDYLTLSRQSPSLSGGESQRIRLASQIGRGLTGVLYILDEPSIGLHPKDNLNLLDTLIRLRDLGNTVVVVEHDEETIRLADHIVDFGPGAGVHGGEVVAAGSLQQVKSKRRSVTGGYMSGKLAIQLPAERRSGNGSRLGLRGVRHNNLDGFDVDIPLGVFVAVTGVSGSGKSSLVTETLYPHLARQYHGSRKQGGKLKNVVGLGQLDKVIEIDQKPIGRTPRSNPATYIGVFDEIRKLFAELPEAKARGFKAGRFSFNVRGGRCEACEGHGQKRIEMHFLPDVWVTCAVCQGRRFDRETLEVTYKGRHIHDVLEMDVEQALEHFRAVPKIRKLLQTLSDVGLDYIKLGQNATTLSGGEAQRVKLAKELARRATGRTLYILDEPTTGLHFADVAKLLEVLQRLVNTGNTILVVEHNLDVVKTADHVIDLGPGGGDAGGRLVVQGTPEDVARCRASHTGKFLKGLLQRKGQASALSSK